MSPVSTFGGGRSLRGWNFVTVDSWGGGGAVLTALLPVTAGETVTVVVRAGGAGEVGLSNGATGGSPRDGEWRRGWRGSDRRDRRGRQRGRVLLCLLHLGYRGRLRVGGPDSGYLTRRDAGLPATRASGPFHHQRGMSRRGGDRTSLSPAPVSPGAFPRGILSDPSAPAYRLPWGGSLSGRSSLWTGDQGEWNIRPINCVHMIWTMIATHDTCCASPRFALLVWARVFSGLRWMRRGWELAHSTGPVPSLPCLSEAAYHVPIKPACSRS